MTDRKFTLPAFAKINLTLRVLGRRADGYHEISTIFQTITLQDRLTFEPLSDSRFELVCSALDIPADETNLVHRAASALRERFNVRQGGRVTLEKRIPAGGGLGGGSSDAAVALLGLSRLWDLTIKRREAAEIGARLGADVPFFFTGGTASGTGTGTDITALEDAPRSELVVVTPAVKVSTAVAYKALNAPALTKVKAAAMLPISHAGGDFSDSHRGGVKHNDFEAVVFSLYPEIGRVKDALLEVGARWAMLSGSGSSVFGVFDSEREVRRALRALNAEAGWHVSPCHTLSRADYRAAFGECGAILEF